MMSSSIQQANVDDTGGTSVPKTEAAPTRSLRWRQLGQILLDEGLLSAEQLEKALTIQQQHGDRKIGEIIISEKMVDEAGVMRCLALQFNREFVHLTRENVDTQALGSVPT